MPKKVNNLDYHSNVSDEMLSKSHRRAMGNKLRELIGRFETKKSQQSNNLNYHADVSSEMLNNQRTDSVKIQLIKQKLENSANPKKQTRMHSPKLKTKVQELRKKFESNTNKDKVVTNTKWYTDYTR